MKKELNLLIYQKNLLEDVLDRLVKQIEVCHKANSYLAVWEMGQRELGIYPGPFYVEELANAKEALKKAATAGM